jgi:hypothetical protein
MGAGLALSLAVSVLAAPVPVRAQSVHEIFVTQYGASCDGVTDDTAAFNAAHAALPDGAAGDLTPGGGTIVLPRGVCLVNNWVISKSSVVVKGMGHGWDFDHHANTPATVLKAGNTATTVMTIASVGTFRTVLKDLTINGGGTADVGVATIGTGWRLERVGLVGAKVRQLDNKVGGSNADSTDSGGIFDSLIAGNIRLASASIRVERTYFNGGFKDGKGVPTAIDIEGISPTLGTTSVTIANNTFDSYGTPVIDVGAVQVVRAITIAGNLLSNVRGAGGSLIKLGHNNGVDTATIGGNFFSGQVAGFTVGRAIEARLVWGLTIRSNYFGGVYSGGTGAPILLDGPWGDHVIEGNTGGDVEWNGYRSQAFVSVHSLNPSVSYNPIGTVMVKGIRIRTTTALASVIYEVPLAPTEAVQIRARVIATGPSGSSFSFIRTVMAKNPGSGATIPPGAVSLDYTYKDDAAADCTFATFGNAVQLVVTGVTATALNWRADIEILRQ